MLGSQRSAIVPQTVPGLPKALAQEIREAAILVLGTYRNGEVGRHPPLAGLLAELPRDQRSLRPIMHGSFKPDVFSSSGS
jgi:hypothetical protein